MCLTFDIFIYSNTKLSESEKTNISSEGPLSPVNELFQKDLNHNSDFVFFIGGSLESP